MKKKYLKFAREFYALCEKNMNEDFDAGELKIVCEEIIYEFT
jgi:hypothetical protein